MKYNNQCFNPLNRGILILTVWRRQLFVDKQKFQSPQSGHFDSYKDGRKATPKIAGSFNPLNRGILILTKPFVITNPMLL